MEVFITWSKSQSHDVAEYLKKWLPLTIVGTEAFMSDEDIEKGTRWSDELMAKLGSTNVGLICVTKENIGSPWIYFEAGAIAAKQKLARVYPYLVGVSKSEIANTPLGLLQATDADEKDTWRLVKSINNMLDNKNAERLLKSHFDKNWKTLKKVLLASTKPLPNEATIVPPPNYRPPRTQSSSPPIPPRFDDNDVLSKLETLLHSLGSAKVHETFVFDDIDRDLKLPTGSSRRLLEKAGTNLGLMVGRTGNSSIKFREGPKDPMEKFLGKGY